MTTSDVPPHVAVIGDVYDDPRLFIVIEQEVVVRDISNFAEALQLMFCLFFNLNLAYPQHKKETFITLSLFRKSCLVSRPKN